VAWSKPKEEYHTMNTDNTEETEVTLSKSAGKALIAALDATIETAMGVAKAIRECFTELLPSLPWKDGHCTLTGAKAAKALPEVQSATSVINKMLLAHERFTVPGEKADTRKLSDSIRNQIGQAKTALGLPKRHINRESGKGKGKQGETEQATPDKATEPMTAAMMEAAEWSPDIVRHEIAQCIILLAGLPAKHEAVIEHINRALVEAGCGELAIVAKPKAEKAQAKPMTKEERIEMIKRKNELMELSERLAAG
jgi:hypothetical protein